MADDALPNGSLHELFSDATEWTSSVPDATPTSPPTVDRSTKPNSLNALSTDCWTGKGSEK